MNIKNFLYNETVELHFESFRHRYTYQGEIVPSVTQVLSIISKPALVGWAAKVAIESVSQQIEAGKKYDELQLQAIFESSRIAHVKKKTDAGNYGTFMHDWLEKYIIARMGNQEFPALPVNEVLKKSIQNFLTWEEQNKVKFLVSEQIVFSKKYGFAGKLDNIAMINGELYILDWKTSNGIYPLEMGAQLAAYKIARQEEFGETYKGVGIVRIDKEDGSLQMWKFQDTRVFEHTFIYALMLYKKSQEIKMLQMTTEFKEGFSKI